MHGKKKVQLSQSQTVKVNNKNKQYSRLKSKMMENVSWFTMSLVKYPGKLVNMLVSEFFLIDIREEKKTS